MAAELFRGGLVMAGGKPRIDKGVPKKGMHKTERDDNTSEETGQRRRETAERKLEGDCVARSEATYSRFGGTSKPVGGGIISRGIEEVNVCSNFLHSLAKIA